MINETTAKPAIESTTGLRTFRGVVLYTLLPLAIIMAAPSAIADGDEIEALRVMIERMQQTHQQEMQAMKARLDALSRQPTRASSVDEDERLSGIEDDIEALYEGQTQLTTEDERFRWGAFPALAFEDFDHEPSIFEAELEFFVDAKIGNRLSAHAQLEFQAGAAGGEDVELELEQAYLEYVVNEGFKPRFGIMLMPWGQYNQRHFDPYQHLHSKPLVWTNVTPGTWHEGGMGFSGRRGFENSAINYEFYIINGIANTFTDGGGSPGASGGDNNSNKGLIGRIGYEMGNDTEFGFAGYLGDYDEEQESEMSGLAVDFRWRRDNFEFKGEYSYFDLEEGLVVARAAGGGHGKSSHEDDDHDDNGDHDEEVEALIGAPAYLYGYYIEGNYHFWPSFLNNSFLNNSFLNTQFPSSKLTASVRYGMVHLADDGDDDNDDGDFRDPDNEERRLSIGLNYRPVDTWQFALEYLFNDTDNEPVAFGNADGLIFSVSAQF